ncbi:MAG: phosphoglucosamine mutase [Cyanobacteria bacterium J083]|nr:MAG: phosphoglucosamine mutase [Cyanobacteria bacterium J083]
MVLSLSQVNQSGLIDLAAISIADMPKILPANSLFGTDGIRGKVGDLLTPKLALQVGICTGLVIKEISSAEKNLVIIGQDSRNSGDMLAMGVATGLIAAGLEVWQLGLCPTPAVATLTHQSEAVAGVMISASHNPPGDNGIKLFSQKGTKLEKKITSQIESKIRQIYENKDKVGNNKFYRSKAWAKNYYRPDLIKNYLAFLEQTLPSHSNFSGMKIVLDLAWGAAVEVAPRIFRKLGAEVICLHATADGNLINVNCGSTHLEKLQAHVLEVGADMGFAFDGDADRVMAVDSRGRVVDGDYILYLWGSYLKEQGKLPNDLIIGTVMANLGFEKAWIKLGGRLQRTAVGDQYVQAEMWETGAMLGGEQSGHILCHHHSYSGDGTQTAVHLASLVRQANCSLAELIDNSFPTYPQVLKNVRVENTEKRSRWQECDALQAAIARAEEQMGETGRVLVRASGTEPVIRIMVEAQESKVVNYWSDYLVKATRQYLGEI